MRPSALLLLVLISLPGWAAEVDPRIAYLSRQLRTGQDVRVRAQAALVLGKSEAAAALAPLCDGLKDESDVVRGASARALGELGNLEAIGCLRAGIADRGTGSSARQAMERSAVALETLRDQPARLYIAMRPFKAQGGVDPEMAVIAEARLKQQLTKMGTRWAPAEEPKAAAMRVLAQEQLQGFVVMPELLPHGDGGLRIKVVCLSYPDERLLGQVESKAKGGRPADLVKALVPHAAKQMAAIFEESRH